MTFIERFKGAVMKLNKSLIIFGLLCALGFSANAQSAWPKIQSDMYPYVSDMKLIRHDQSIVLGEGVQQTGIFFSTLSGTYSEKLQRDLISDAVKKNWQLNSLYRVGTTFVMSFVQDRRLLDIRLTNLSDGVDVIYSIVLRQEEASNSLSLKLPLALALAEPVADAPSHPVEAVATDANYQ
jgi:hypothetical protein